MRFLLPLLIPLALYGSGCSLPVGAQEMIEAGPTEMMVPDVMGMDGVQAIMTLRDQGLAYRLHTSPNGPEGTVRNQLPKAGLPIAPGKTVDLIINGDDRVIAMIEAAAKPPEPVEETPDEQAQLAAIRERLDGRYALDTEAIANVTMPEIKGIDHSRTRVELPPVPSPSPSAEVKAADKPIAQGEQPLPSLVPVDGSEVLTGPQQVNLGVWSVTLPGPTKAYSTEIHGFAVNGYATRTEDGKVIAAGCSTIESRNGGSLPAGMVDQLLLSAPYRYGQPERFGRYSSAQMPGMSSIVATGTGKARVVTWYGYGQLCDVLVPVDAQGRSDHLIEPILQSLQPS